MLTLLNVLPDLGYKVIHIGVFSDAVAEKDFEQSKIEFWRTVAYNGDANFAKKFRQQLQYKYQVKRYLKEAKLTDDDTIWLMQAETICLLNKIIGTYRTILHFFEFIEPRINWKYKIISPFYNPCVTFKKAHKIVCCEYNRAQIMKGLFQLEYLPVVLPNKMYIKESTLSVIPDDIKSLFAKIQDKLYGKKVVLYQGIFLDKERRLEEFCEAVLNMSNDYILVVMGKGDGMYNALKKKYESDKIIFIPFIRPPYHLLITRLATIGVLSYFPRSGSISRTINPLYCAPNKIFEYAKYHIPMISNDIPALKYAFMEYRCGECVSYPMTSQKIAIEIQKIVADLSNYQQGAKDLFESIDVKKIIQEIMD